MPPSQLKRLKSSLREQGITGPQKSKKQKLAASKSGVSQDRRVQRNVALQGIREQFNPFEVKTSARGEKYEFAAIKPTGGKMAQGAMGRPGVTRGLGEENRRKTLLVEMQRRKKVGGIVDRRFGENDPSMTPEAKALERFVREKQRGTKKGSIFDLEDDEEDSELTHFGKSLSFGQTDSSGNFKDDGLAVSDEDGDIEKADHRNRKRRKLSHDDDLSSGQDDVSRLGTSKTKAEVMKEVIAKSKLHKYERQQAKEDDDDLRAELDKGLPDLYALMRGTPQQRSLEEPLAKTGNAAMNPDRLALLNGKDRSQADKEYDERIRQMTMDQRANPTERTLTEDEKRQQEATRLKGLEEERQRRMRGEQEISDEEDDQGTKQELQHIENMDDEAVKFGLGVGIQPNRSEQLVLEDEDEFVLDEDQVASGSDTEISDDDMSFEGSQKNETDDENDGFVQGLLSNDFTGRHALALEAEEMAPQTNGSASNLAYTYSCPQTQEEFLEVTKETTIDEIPIVVQRIRALHHPQLVQGNKTKLGVFSTVLVDHISYLANQQTHPPFTVLESLIRHIHSLAKTFPEEIGRAFRKHLNDLYKKRPTAPLAGDLVILTAIGSIFPTSDHFHQVVTPAILCIERYLSQKTPQSLDDVAVGTYMETLCLHYQRLSKRYIPELINYSLNILYVLAPAKPNPIPTCSPYRDPATSLRITKVTTQSKTSEQSEGTRLNFWIFLDPTSQPSEDTEAQKATLLSTQLAVITTLAHLWSSKPASHEIFQPISTLLTHLTSPACTPYLPSHLLSNIRTVSQTIQNHLYHTTLHRRPLRLHSHRALAIKTSIPKFEDGYNPDKHYDPDRTRADTSKLKAEHKRERKGAMRELRKDANFMAREGLREKKERDAEYERKQKRLVAEIQGEEGREAKIFEREKRMRRSRLRK